MIGALMSAGAPFPKAPLDFVVIKFSDRRVRKTALAARARGLNYILWPQNLYLSETRPEERKKQFDVLKAAKPDMGWIFNLETNPDGAPLSGVFLEHFIDGLFEFKNFSIAGDFMGLPKTAHISEDPFARHVLVSRRVQGKDYPLLYNSDEIQIARKSRGRIILAGSPRADYALLKKHRVI